MVCEVVSCVLILVKSRSVCFSCFMYPLTISTKFGISSERCFRSTSMLAEDFLMLFLSCMRRLKMLMMYPITIMLMIIMRYVRYVFIMSHRFSLFFVLNVQCFFGRLFDLY